MRVGTSPNKAATTDYKPARVTVCVLVSVPNQDGYYAHRLDVVKLCLASILKNSVAGSYDLLVFDNGSCSAAVDYLLSLRDRGEIQYLILSAQNVGKANAYRIMFQAAPGEIVAYADDDILFYPEWLDAELRVLETFPRVGMVSGVPVRHQFRYGNRYLQAYLEECPEMSVKRGRFISDEWEREFSMGSGRSGPEVAEEKAKTDEIVLTYRGVSAYSTAVHFQFLAWRHVILKGLQPDFDARLMREPVREVDERLDAMGYARLSTTDRYVRHLGNVVSEDLAGEIKRLGLADRVNVWTPPGLVARRLALTSRIAQRLRNWHYFASRYRPQQ